MFAIVLNKLLTKLKNVLRELFCFFKIVFTPVGFGIAHHIAF